MEKLEIKSQDPSKLPAVLYAALSLCGSPQYLHIRPIGDPVDHVYLATAAEPAGRGDAWEPLQPGSSADFVAARLALALPAIADRGFSIRMLEHPSARMLSKGLAPGSGPAFCIEPYGN